jgi:hypothetical protein
MKKALTDLSENELLDLIRNEPSSVKIYEWPDDIMEFISIYNIKGGKELVTFRLLYKLYKKWSKNPIKFEPFISSLRDILPSHSSYILLNRKALNVKEEVFKYLKQDDKTKYKGHIDTYNRFRNDYCIKRGGLFIKDTVLYDLYLKWCKKRPLSIRQFKMFCKMYFDEKLIDKHYWFGVDKSINDYLTEELINEMRKPSDPKKTKQKI